MDSKREVKISDRVFKIIKWLIFVIIAIFLVKSLKFSLGVLSEDGFTYLFWFSLAPVLFGVYSIPLVGCMLNAKLDSKVLRSPEIKYGISIITSVFLVTAMLLCVCFMFSFLGNINSSTTVSGIPWNYVRTIVIYTNGVSLLVTSLFWIAGFILIDCLAGITRYRKKLKDSVTMDKGKWVLSETSLVPEGTVPDFSPIMCPTGPECEHIVLGRDQDSSNEGDFSNEEEEKFADPVVIGESTGDKDNTIVGEVGPEVYDYLMSAEVTNEDINK